MAGGGPSDPPGIIRGVILWVLVCDGCQARAAEPHPSQAEAQSPAPGWVFRNGPDGGDFCPACAAALPPPPRPVTRW
jgi:hypothetical protein